MKITLEEVRRIAHLAHLRFTDDELEALRGELDQILGYVDQLNELDVSGVEPAAGVTAGRLARWREDVRGDTLESQEVMNNAPDSGEGHFKVPRVIS